VEDLISTLGVSTGAVVYAIRFFLLRRGSVTSAFCFIRLAPLRSAERGSRVLLARNMNNASMREEQHDH